MVQNLPSDHLSTPNLMLNSKHARLAPHTSAFSEAPATARRSNTIPVLKDLAMVTLVPGNGAPAAGDVRVSPLFKHGLVAEVLARNGAGRALCGNQNHALQCQTTMDLDCHVVSDGESECFEPRNPRDNSNSEAVMVDLDTLPDESPVELQFPWSPVHQGEASLHTPTFQWSSENLQVSATKLTPKELEEQLRLKEAEFNAAFKLETQRCTPAARCRSCLAFCQARLPLRLRTSQEGGGTGGGQLREECPPVLRNIVDNEAGRARKRVRHGPKSKSSEYRGVTFYKRTGRWEAHIWHEGAQVYLGASRTKEEAARVYDQAALLLCGPHVDINFKPESYHLEMAYLYKLSKEQLVHYLRRDSRGFGAQVSYPGVKHVKNFYQANYGQILLGTFAIEEDAARAVYKEAVRDSFGALASLILDTHHVRNMPSYATQRLAALYPATPASASAIAAPLHPGAAEQLPGSKVNEKIMAIPSALTPTRSWGANMAPRTRQRHAACSNRVAARTDSSSCRAPSVPSLPRATGEASCPAVIKFMLFNVEISVAVEPGHGGDRTEAHGESIPKLCSQSISPARNRCETMGAAAPATPNPKLKILCKKCLLRRSKATEV